MVMGGRRQRPYFRIERIQHSGAALSVVVRSSNQVFCAYDGPPRAGVGCLAPPQEQVAALRLRGVTQAGASQWIAVSFPKARRTMPGLAVRIARPGT